MSLSGQYLEELSRRYKKQVEELQHSFAKTLVNIEEQSRRNLERKQELFEQNQQLRNEVEILTERLFSWRNILICCICFTCVQILIFHVILRIWGRKYGLTQSITASTEATNTMERKRKTGNIQPKFRRKSAEEKRERNLSESSSSALQRRPSSEALNITGTYVELLIDEPNQTRNSSSELDLTEKNTHYNKTSNYSSHDADMSGYVRIEDLKDLYDKPGEEYEFYGPVVDNRRNESAMDDCASETTAESSLDSVSLQPKKVKTKTAKSKHKNRRLSSPSFFRAAFSGSSAAQSTRWEWHKSSKSQNSSQRINKKSKSESPPALKQNGINVNNNSMPAMIKSADTQTRSPLNASMDERKTSGSFKRILKKIF